MKNNNSTPFAFRFLLIFGLVAILSSSAAGPQITPAFAQEGDNNGMQPLDVNGSSLYYYLDGQRVNLTPSLDWVSVKFVSDDETEQEAATGKFGSTVSSLDGARSVPHLGLTLLPVNDGLNSKSFVQGVNSMRSDPVSFSQVNPVYSYDNIDMVVSDEFVAAFPETTGMAEIEAFNSARGVELISPITGQANTFVLRITSESSLDALGMANQYQESGFVLFAAPNFVRLVTEDETTSQKPSQPGPMYTPDDTYYTPDQWHLNNTGQWGGTSDADIDAPEAWDVTTGIASVTIAVIDEGVDLTHADLVGNMLAGYDATGLGSAGAPTGDDAHGTAVAGLAAAVSNNTLGVAGVCPLCTILPVRIAYGNGSGGWVYTDAWAADAIGWAYTNGADVLNNSWGGGSGATVVNTAITNAVTNGRGGLGSVVVFAAGNDNASTVSWPASQSDVVAVGASNQCDQRKTPTNNTCNGFEDWWGSNYGSALDVVAPGVWLTTTDITGADGYNDGTDPDYTEDYTGYMNGTSGAAPIVSGVLGLMMTVNPYMPADGLQDILEQTADDINTAGWDNETGHGRVNALKAAQAAELPDLVITGYELYNAANTTPLVTQPLAGESFWIHMTVKNRGGSTGNFYPGVFLDDKPNYGPDHDVSFIPGYPVTLALGETTDYQGYKTTDADAQQGAGCRYYDPNDLVVPTSSDVEAERGNYHPIAFLPGISAGGQTTVEVEIAYPDIPEYPDPPYGDIRTGLSAGTYNAYLYVDPVCNVEESLENNNSYGPISVQVGKQVDVFIATDVDPKGTYYLGSSDRVFPSYSGVIDGPVRVSGDSAFITSERSLYGPVQNFNEVPGYPDNQLTNHYWFPWYDHKDMGTWILIGNPSNALTAHVQVKINGNYMDNTDVTPYSIPPNGRIFPAYAGVQTGPVEIISDINVVTSERSLFGPNQTFNEIMGFPHNQLTNHYLFPWYDHKDMGTWILIGNPSSTTTAHVQVKIGGNYMDNTNVTPYAIPPNGRIFPSYAGVQTGPAEVISDIPVITSERSIFGPAQNFEEVMGFPYTKLTTHYWFPWYDHKDMGTWILIGNPSSTTTAHVQVKIGGNYMDNTDITPYAIPPNGRIFPSFAGVQTGPVEITSDINVVTSERSLFGPYQTFNEVMGFPNGDMTTEYWFPWYDHVGMGTWILIATP